MIMERIEPLSIGFSPCPNDTFIFYGLMHGRVGENCRLFSQETLADVETLNCRAMNGQLDVTKISFHALGHVLDTYTLLMAGGALGRGCGPLLVAGKGIRSDDLAGMTIAIPGRYTTAAMLLGLFAPDCDRLRIMPFDRIMPAIVAGEVEAGVIIHESRFTYPQYGLQLLQDLGSWWEKVSGHPIPLGGIVARTTLGREMIGRIEKCIRASVRWGFANRELCMPYIRQHAQELDDRVIGDHIDLYVNQYSEDFGPEGMAAIRDFLRRGGEAGLLPAGTELTVGGGALQD